MNLLVLDGNGLTLDQCSQFVRLFPKVSIDEQALERMRESRRVVREAVESGRTIYGVNTGFGKLADVRVDRADLEALQLNLIRSHAAGVGEPLPETIVRLIMLLKANALAKGYSGVRPVLATSLLSLLNRGILPIIPSKGSVGASGDLAPLAHLALTLVGEGRVLYRGREQPAVFALRHQGLNVLSLQAKEGLAILNGTQVSLAFGIAGLLRIQNLIQVADILGATSVEALKGTDVPFTPGIQEVRNQRGQSLSARNLHRLLRESEIHESHRDCGKIQDMYSLRCMPQVHGAVRDAVSYAADVFEREANASTDNPVVFPESGAILSGGNFHAEPLGIPLDTLGTAAAELGSISERRIAAMQDPTVSQMPAFLTEASGLQSGYMLPHVVSASLASENKVLAHPSSVDSLPTSANQEDHVSMAAFAGRKLLEIVGNVETILAIEWLCAVQGLDLKGGLKPAKALEPSCELLRAHVPKYERDREHSGDIAKAVELIRTGELVRVIAEQTKLV